MTDLKDVFDYDVNDGFLIRKDRGPSFFTSYAKYALWKRRFANKKTGSMTWDKKGNKSCVLVSFDGSMKKAHRIIWQMHYGKIPDKMEIDHIDGNPFNNRIGNLRLATSSQNGCNSRVRSNSRSRLKGVIWRDRKNPWRAQIKLVGGGIKVLGHFPTKGLAAVAYAKAALRYHGEYYRVS